MAARRAGNGRSPGENQRRHTELGQQLQERGFPLIEGIGQHPGNGWPGEPSWLVLGMDRAAARALGIALSQNAILWNADDAVCRLILLR